MELLTILAAAEEHAEPSKTAFYVAGGLLATWAVAVSAVGLARQDFPGTATVSRAVMAISAVLVVAALAAMLATS